MNPVDHAGIPGFKTINNMHGHAVLVSNNNYYTASMLRYFGPLNKTENRVAVKNGDDDNKIVSFKYEEDLLIFKLKFKL